MIVDYLNEQDEYFNMNSKMISVICKIVKTKSINKVEYIFKKYFQEYYDYNYSLNMNKRTINTTVKAYLSILIGKYMNFEISTIKKIFYLYELVFCYYNENHKYCRYFFLILIVVCIGHDKSLFLSEDLKPFLKKIVKHDFGEKHSHIIQKYSSEPLDKIELITIYKDIKNNKNLDINIFISDIYPMIYRLKM